MPTEAHPSLSDSHSLRHWQLTFLATSLTNQENLDGVCNGFTNMWIQAVMQGAGEEDAFYTRLEKISKYFNSVKIKKKDLNMAVDKIIKLKEDIQSIYKNRVASKTKLPLSEEEQGLIEIQAFCESIVLQQNPNSFHIFPNRVNQNAPKIDALTASKKLEDDHQSIQRVSINTLAVTQEELAHYLDKIQKIVLASGTSEKVLFTLGSSHHAVGLCFNPSQKTWSYLDINTLENCRPHQYTNTQALSKAIFKGFGNISNHAIFSIEHAFIKNNLSMVNTLQSLPYSDDPDVYSRSDDKGTTLLYLAAMNNDVERVESLLKQGALVNVRSKDNSLPLIVAAQNGHIHIIEKLLKAGADINATDSKGRSALMPAAQWGHFDIVNTLLREKADSNLETKHGGTALLLAAQNGHTEIVKALLDSGVLIDKISKSGLFALIIATQYNHLPTVQLLLAKGAKINLASSKGITPLMLASVHKNVTLIKILIEATLKSRADINQPGPLGYTALDGAIATGNVEITRLLLTAGAKLPSFSHKIKYFMKGLMKPVIIIPALAGILSLAFGAPLAVGIIFCVIALGFAAKMAYGQYKHYHSNNIFIQKVLNMPESKVSVSPPPTLGASPTLTTEVSPNPVVHQKMSNPIPDIPQNLGNKTYR